MLPESMCVGRYQHKSHLSVLQTSAWHSNVQDLLKHRKLKQNFTQSRKCLPLLLSSSSNFGQQAEFIGFLTFLEGWHVVKEPNKSS